jgi:hypothetical protein
MRYQQPWGISDVNAGYINGNPSTGTMGSIPPAASIEYPQREVVNLIADAAITPSDADLHQLARGVQSGRLNYGVDTGAANALVVAMSPPLLAYAAGQRWAVKVLNTNTTSTTININGLGVRPIRFPNNTALIGGELVAGSVVGLVDDGTKLQLQNVFNNVLVAPLHYYVNASTGSDTSYDGTLATVSGSRGPFQTVNKAISATISWNLNGKSVTIHVADGTYASFTTQPLNGSGDVTIVGNVANPTSAHIAAASGPAIKVENDGYTIEGFKVTSPSSGVSGPGSGVRINNAKLRLGSMDFGFCIDQHLQVDGGGYCLIPSTATQKVTAGCDQHIRVAGASYVQADDPALQITTALTVNQWMYITNGSTYIGAHSSISGKASVTGKRFVVSNNSLLNTSSGLNNYFPGDVAGTVNDGGLYL